MSSPLLPLGMGPVALPVQPPLSAVAPVPAPGLPPAIPAPGIPLPGQSLMISPEAAQVLRNQTLGQQAAGQPKAGQAPQAPEGKGKKKGKGKGQKSLPPGLAKKGPGHPGYDNWVKQHGDPQAAQPQATAKAGPVVAQPGVAPMGVAAPNNPAAAPRPAALPGALSGLPPEQAAQIARTDALIGGLQQVRNAPVSRPDGPPGILDGISQSLAQGPEAFILRIFNNISANDQNQTAAGLRLIGSPGLPQF